MEKSEKQYHHGNLQTALIEEGLALIHEEGQGAFSLRKVAKRAGVSAAACYNHYENAEELMNAMRKYVGEKFAATLKTAIEEDKCHFIPVSAGRAYVDFFAKNPHYFAYMFDDDGYEIHLTKQGVDGTNPYAKILNEIVESGMKRFDVPREKLQENVISMWAIVHGLAAMANMKGFQYEGDWGELTESILNSKIKIN